MPGTTTPTCIDSFLRIYWKGISATKQIPATIGNCCSDTWNNTVPETIDYLKSDEAKEAYWNTTGAVLGAHVAAFTMAEGAEAAYLVAGGTGATAFEIEGTATLKLEGARKGVPQKVLDVVDDIRLNKGAPPRGFKGGRTFKNDGRGGGQARRFTV